MEITNFGFFTRTPDPQSSFVIAFRNEVGQDWYDVRPALTSWDERGNFVSAVYGAWATVDADGVVINVEADPSRLVPDDRFVLGIDADPADIAVGMVYRNGVLAPAPVPVNTPTLVDYSNAIQSLIDRCARGKRYDSGVSLASYLGSVVDEYASDARAFVDWRDPLWKYALDAFALVEAGQREMPTIPAFLAELVGEFPPPWAVPAE